MSNEPISGERPTYGTPIEPLAHLAERDCSFDPVAALARFLERMDESAQLMGVRDLQPRVNAYPQPEEVTVHRTVLARSLSVCPA